MPNKIGYFIYSFLAAIATLLGAFYLIYIKFNPAKRESATHKYKKGTSAYDLYNKIYSTQFLGIWLLLTFSFIINLSFDLYRSTHSVSLFALTSILMLSISASLTGLYLWIALFRKK